jgi:predicted neutral ceramidase superfamily lipid hydrolase
MNFSHNYLLYIFGRIQHTANFPMKPLSIQYSEDETNVTGIGKYRYMNKIYFYDSVVSITNKTFLMLLVYYLIYLQFFSLFVCKYNCL